MRGMDAKIYQATDLPTHNWEQASLTIMHNQWHANNIHELDWAVNVLLRVQSWVTLGLVKRVPA